MKAILLADGDDGGLWPLCSGQPRCMIPLLGRSILAHAAVQLAKSGMNQLMVLLPRGSGRGMECLRRDGDLGLEVLWKEVGGPWSQADALRSCASFIDGDDFLLVCGNVVWDFDLGHALALHQARGAIATLTMAYSPTPEQCVAVACDRLGRVVYFEQSPPLARCESVAVSTGITVCAPEVLHYLREDDGDLARDLFPRLLNEGRLWGVSVDGNWKEIRDNAGLLSGAAGLLSHKADCLPKQLERRPGIYSADPLPDGIELVPPCWLASGVCVGTGSLIGPHAVLEEGTKIGPRSLIQRSLLHGATLGERAVLYGAIVGRKAKLASRCVLNEGAVVGAHAELGDNVNLMEGVLVAPGVKIPNDSCLEKQSPERGRGPVAAFGPEENGKNSLYFL